MTDEEHPGAGRHEVRPDPGSSTAWVVVSDGVPQSYVDLADPDRLHLSYLHAVAALCAALPGGPARALDVVHVGGAGLSLLRHLAAHRPGSRHVAVEPDAALTAVVVERLPTGADVDVEHVALDGRAALARRGGDSADLVIVDAFVGDRVPGSLTTRECLADVRRVVRPGGHLVLNLGDAADHGFLRRLVATVRPTFPELVVAGKPAPVAGTGYGNLVLGAGDVAWDEDRVRAALEDRPVTLALLTGADLAAYDGEPLRDAAPVDSPGLADVLRSSDPSGSPRAPRDR